MFRLRVRTGAITKEGKDAKDAVLFAVDVSERVGLCKHRTLRSRRRLPVGFVSQCLLAYGRNFLRGNGRRGFRLSGSRRRRSFGRRKPEETRVVAATDDDDGDDDVVAAGVLSFRRPAREPLGSVTRPPWSCRMSRGTSPPSLPSSCLALPTRPLTAGYK